jgi:TolB protein
MSARGLAVLGAAAALLLVSAQGAPAAFPGNNGKLAFSGSSGHTGIWVSNADGTGETALTTSPGSDPAWSADGQKIAFGYQGGIAVMNADGTGEKQLTIGSADSHPTWSPDGKKIAFTRDVMGSAEVMVMKSDGTGVKALTPGYTPAWSPDGTTIAFTGDCGIDTISPGGTGWAMLTTTCGDFEPSWSPDGYRLVFASNDGLTEIDADGTGRTVVTTDWRDSTPAWSPDGSKIAFTRVTGSDAEVFVMNEGGSAQTQVTFDSPGNFAVDWQPVPFTFADLLLRLSAKARLCQGCAFLYKMKVSNGGPSGADYVVVTDPLPAGTSFVSARTSRGSCAAPSPASGEAVTCSLGSLSGGTRVVIIVVCRVTGEGRIANRASVTSSTSDPDPGNNVAVAVSVVR